MSIETPEMMREFEHRLFELKKQYESQRNLLDVLGYFVDKTQELLENPLLEHPRVIRGIDGKEYPFPSWKDVQTALTKDTETKDKYREQFRRGFTELHMTPFAIPINRHLDLLKAALLREYKKNNGHIYSAAPDIHNTTLDQLQQDPSLAFPLDPDEPLYQWDNYNNADQTDTMVYFPTQLTQTDHGGKTKQEILTTQTQTNSPFPGFLLSLTHTHTDIPRQGNSPNKHLLEANKTPIQYLHTLTTENQDPTHPHAHQRGQTIEEAITLMVTTLIQKHQLIDDYNKNGSLNYTLGTWFPCARVVGSVYAYRGLPQVRVGGDLPDYRDEDCGARSAVGIGDY